MLLSSMRAFAAQRGMGCVAAQIQAATAAAVLRSFSSFTSLGSPADEINAEMAQFGIGPAALAQQQRAWQLSGPDAAAGSIAAGAASAAAGSPPAELVAEVQSVNSELFGFFGAPPSRPDGAAEGAAAGLAQQLAALAGQAAPSSSSGGNPCELSSAGGSSSSSSSSSSNGSTLNVGSLHASRGSPGSSTDTISSSSRSSSSSSSEGHKLTHVDASGKATMVDVSHKGGTVRTAVAGARVLLGRHVFDLVASNQMRKGDVLTVAQLAGVMGAKHTATLIPLCHNILLSRVHVALSLDFEAAAVAVTASATTVGPTGVEMEALTAAAVAALTVYDMCKAASKGVVITDLRLLAKSGGKSGDWQAAEEGGGAPA